MVDRISQLKFDLTNRLEDTWSALKRVAGFKVPEYHPFIKIRLSRADAKIIYRAVPRNGQIAIFILIRLATSLLLIEDFSLSL